MIDQAAPRWVRELETLLPTCSNYLLSGNIHDQFLITRLSSNSATRVLRTITALLSETLLEAGFQAVLAFDLDEGASFLGQAEPALPLDQLIGAQANEFVTEEPLHGLAELIKRVSAAIEPVALVIPFASRLAQDVARLSETEFEFFRRADVACRRARPVRTSSDRAVFNPIIWLLDSENHVPTWFISHNELLRSIAIPLPHTGERRELAARLVPSLSGGTEASITEGIRVLSEQMAGLPLVALQKAVQIARDQGISPERVEDAARSYRVGVTDNPWRAAHLTERIAAELQSVSATLTGSEPAPGSLPSRVIGQNVAVQKSLDILVRSSVGLTAAQAGPTATRPRGVLFFAGPTGVGKTELAKALTKLLFDDERFYVRFDMSEFSAEQAADRLIGSPPGYVGFTQGGELTNAMRERPFSLVLFDEIEKAHPRILDKFLQILDDGRLTDGRGETVYFTESVVVFTSNLGIYESVSERGPDGLPHQSRRMAFDRSQLSYDDMAASVTTSIQRYFTLDLGRPELLNRIGDNIVVFDFIPPDVGRQILLLMIHNVFDRVRQEHSVDLSLGTGSLELLASACLSESVLQLGGRGIGAKLETTFINPLARALFLRKPLAGSRVEASVERRQSGWNVDFK